MIILKLTQEELNLFDEAYKAFIENLDKTHNSAVDSEEEHQRNMGLIEDVGLKLIAARKGGGD